MPVLEIRAFYFSVVVYAVIFEHLGGIRAATLVVEDFIRSIGSLV